MPCSGSAGTGGINGTEIAVELNPLSEIVGLALYDESGTLVPASDGTLYPRINPVNNNCDAYIDFPPYGGLGQAIKYPSIPGVVTVEFRFLSGERYRILYADGGSSSLSTGFCGAGDADSFFCPNVSVGGSGDADFLAVLNSPTDVRISPTWMFSTTDYVDEAIAGNDWVIPYQNDIICADPDVTCGGVSSPQDAVTAKSLFLMPVDEVFVRGAPLTKRLSRLLTLPSQGVYNWNEGWLSLAFAPGAGLTVESRDFATRGMTFTASDLAQGWDGLVLRPGSVGVLDNVSIHRVRDYGNFFQIRYSLTLEDATASVVGSYIEAPATDKVGGVRVSGSQASILLRENQIMGMTASSVAISNSAQAILNNNSLYDNQGSGLIASYGASVYVARQVEGSEFGMSNKIYRNSGWGVDAVAGGVVQHVDFGIPAPYLTSRGYSYVVENDAGGISTRFGAYQDAGSLNDYARDNWFQDNGTTSYVYFDGKGPDALAQHTGSVLYATYDWWGRPSNPDTTAFFGTSQEAFLVVDPMLTAPPTSAPNQITAQTSANDVLSLRDLGGERESSVASSKVPESERHKKPIRTLGAAESILVERPLSSGAAAALQWASFAASSKVSDRSTRAGALSLLQRETLSPLPEHRGWAYRGLLLARDRLGDAAGALDAADALIRGEHEYDTVSIGLGYLGRAYLLARRRNANEAWAAWAEAAKRLDDSEVIGLARMDIAWMTDTEPLEVAGFVNPRISNHAVVDGDFGLGAPYPNPATDTYRVITIPYKLAESGVPHIAIYDVLGRQVAVLTDGRQEGGAYEARFDTEALAAGAYVVRLTATGSPASMRTITVQR